MTSFIKNLEQMMFARNDSRVMSIESDTVFFFNRNLRTLYNLIRNVDVETLIGHSSLH